MTIIQAIILGIVQGLTEFLPISSSAHLAIVPYLLNWHIPQAQVFPFDVLVQDGTLAAVIIYFWKDLWGILTAVLSGIWQHKPFADPRARLGWLLVLATIPAGIIGLLLKSQVEAAFSSPLVIGASLLITAALLLVAEWLGKHQRPMSSVRWLDALWIGLFQAISIFPGISRSGMTITGGMTRNLDRPASARFAFLMSVPVMLAAGLLEGKDVVTNPELAGLLPLVLVGLVVAGVVGYFSIRWMLAYLNKSSLRIFAYYCIAAGLITGLVALLK